MRNGRGCRGVFVVFFFFLTSLGLSATHRPPSVTWELGKQNLCSWKGTCPLVGIQCLLQVFVAGQMGPSVRGEHGVKQQEAQRTTLRQHRRTFSTNVSSRILPLIHLHVLSSAPHSFILKQAAFLNTHSGDLQVVNPSSSKPQVQHSNHIQHPRWLQHHTAFLLHTCWWDCSTPLVASQNKED